MDRTIIDEYVRQASVLPAAIKGLSAAELNAHPVPNTWSIRHIVMHLMDSDLIASDRMKRIIAEDNPTLIGFDESAFAANLFYDQLDAAMAVEVFAKNRMLTGEILRRLPEQAFDRAGTHNQRGRVTLGDLVKMYVQHLDHHMKFLKHKRQLLGKAS
ncbi:MAG: DinB family protein [Planctomycetia bacterium]|nr:DinB family protein [Planctomycetia bacterium]